MKPLIKPIYDAFQYDLESEQGRLDMPYRMMMRLGFYAGFLAAARHFERPEAEECAKEIEVLDRAMKDLARLLGLPA